MGKSIQKVGFDCNGVIVHYHMGEDSLLEPGAIVGVRTIVQAIGAKNCHIVSMIQERDKAHYLQVFDRFDFYNQTGFLTTNIHFIFNPKKAEIIKQLKLTDFVDDSPGVMLTLPSSVKKYLFRCGTSPQPITEPSQLILAEAIQFCTLIHDWDSLTKKLLK